MKISFYTIILVISCTLVGFTSVGIVLYNSNKLNIQQQKIQTLEKEFLRTKETTILLNQWLMSLDLYLINRQAYIYDSLAAQSEAIQFLTTQFNVKNDLKDLSNKINRVIKLCSDVHSPGRRSLNDNEWNEIISQSDVITQDIYLPLEKHQKALSNEILNYKSKIETSQVVFKRTIFICPTIFLLFAFLMIKWSNSTIAKPIKLLKELALDEEISSDNFPYENPIELKSLAEILSKHVKDLEKAKEFAWTKAKQAEHANTRISNIMETAADAIVCTDSKGQIIQMNAAFREISSVNDEAIEKGLSCYDFLDGIQFENYEFDENEVSVKQTLLKNAKGEQIKIELSLSKFNIDDATYFTLIFRDIREREKMQQQLLQSQKLDSIGILASGIAHEINTPVQYITNYSLFLQDSYLDIMTYLEKSNNSDPSELKELYDELDIDFIKEEVPSALKGSLEGLSKVSEIVKSMKVMAHPSQAKKVSYSIHSLLKEAVVLSKNQWNQFADIKMSFDEDLPEILCYPGYLSQTFLNIIINASHAIEAQINTQTIKTQGTITISTKSENNHVIIKFSDTGIGISDKIRTKVFDPFFTTKDVGVGTGQGLALSHDFIVNKHLGSIDFKSNRGQGCTFKIILPIS